MVWPSDLVVNDPDLHPCRPTRTERNVGSARPRPRKGDHKRLICPMDVHNVRIDRAKLAAKPENERVLLLQLAHASNEINVLTKLILMMRKDTPASQIIDHVEAGQTFIFMRLLIGKLHEAWELFKNRAQNDSAIRTTYLPKLPPEGAKALQELNRHFGQGSALTAIRNKISFGKHGINDARNRVLGGCSLNVREISLPNGRPVQAVVTRIVKVVTHHLPNAFEGRDAISRNAGAVCLSAQYLRVRGLRRHGRRRSKGCQSQHLATRR
jgi:hypothetical protein